MGFSLSKGKAKIEGLKYLKAEHITDGKDHISFVVKSIKPPPKGLNLTCIMELETPLYGRDYFPVSRTNWLMLASSWPSDDTDSLIGCTVQLRVIVSASQPTQGRPRAATGPTYSRLHFESITPPAIKGKKQEPISITELPRRERQRFDGEEAPPPDDKDCPF